VKIPASHDEREELYKEIIINAFASREDRKSLYSILKNYYLYGNGNIQQSADYNKLFPHIDLLSSFLFSGETTTFVIETSEDSDNQDPIIEQKKAQKLLPALNQNWHDSNTDILFNEALNWALVYSTMLLKMVPMGHGKFGIYLVEPHNFGVLREDIPMLDNQEAMVHEYYMGESEFQRRISAFGEEEQIRLKTAVGSSFQEISTGADSIPMPLAKLIVTATSPNITGQLAANITAQYDFSPKIQEPCCVCQEVTVWDDDLKDYRMATMIEGKALFYDAQGNTFVPNEHPYIKITPNMMNTYFWGRTELMFLIPLQEWVNVRIQEIRKVLAKIADPPMAGIGMSGVVEEKWLQLPGDRVATDVPAGSITSFAPAPPTDLFKELQMIEQLFDEVSGIRELMQGKGAPGVRATSHADLLVRVGSSRVKKKAAILEDAVEKVGSLILAFMRKYDDTHYKTDDGLTFIAKELSSRSSVKVDSHSSSPIFIDQQLQKANDAFKAGAIDKEDLIDAFKFQNAAYMKVKLKKREAMNDMLSAIKNTLESANGTNDLQVLEKLKNMFEKK